MHRSVLLKPLHNHFITVSPETQVPLELMPYLVSLFPAVLILTADGFVDTLEMNHLVKLFKNHVPKELEVSDEQVKKTIKSLVYSSKYWKSPFLECLKELYVLGLVKADVLEIMIQAACASAGNITTNVLLGTLNPSLNKSPLIDQKDVFFSEVEKQEFRDICEFLGLLENNENRQKFLNLMS